MKKVRLFCLPCAGGTASTYNRWKKHLPHWVEVLPLELAGRGRRSEENFYNTFEEAVDDVFTKAKGYFNEMPYAIFGHSMGSWIAYELLYRIKNSGLKMPVHVFFSARGAPDIPYNGVVYHQLNDEDFKREIVRLGGVPQIVYETDEMFNNYLPLIRADCKIIENYSYSAKKDKLDTDFSVIYAARDLMTDGDSGDEWRKHTKGFCEIKILEGKHFYILENIQTITKYIAEKLIAYS